jgi:hypothetical protein
MRYNQQQRYICGLELYFRLQAKGKEATDDGSACVSFQIPLLADFSVRLLNRVRHVMNIHGNHATEILATPWSINLNPINDHQRNRVENLERSHPRRAA